MTGEVGYTNRIALIGFGEAGQAFVEGLGGDPARFAVYDVLTDDPGRRAAKRGDYARLGVTGAESAADALAGAGLALSLVTADQAECAARQAAEAIAPYALYCDCNSVAPETKRAAAAAIEAAGGRYVDVAVMSPVRPARNGAPMLASGPHSAEAAAALAVLGFNVRPIEGPVGAASAIKMIRSIMVKGMEALTAECFLSAYAAGVEDEVIASLDASWPGWGWRSRADYNLDRMLVHGRRRAAEMRESAATAAGLGLGGAMARATADWQDRIGGLGLAAPPEGLAAKARTILEAERMARS